MNYINLLRVIATLMVFFLHTALFDGGNFKAGQIFNEYWWSFIFKTPAWAGCWIFFVISGFLAGKNFLDNKYTVTSSGIKKYYYRKIKKIYLPTVAFSLAAILFVYPDFIINNTNYLLDILTFSYNGIPGMPGIGATWFVFTLMWLYFITPLCICFLKKANNTLKIAIVVFFLGILNRLICYYYHIDWYRYVYTAPWSNFDLYFCGMIAAYSKKDFWKYMNKKISLMLFIGFILLNSYLYANNCYMELYMFVFPSVYLLFTILCLNGKTRLMKSNYISRIIDYFADISFEFYLFHSLILYRIAPFVYGDNSSIGYIKLLITTAFLSIFCSISFKRIFSR